MRLLVLGGTAFVGRAVVAAAVGHGWTVTTFSWDRTPADAPPVEHVVGDRTRQAGLSLLDGRTWDYVVDTWQGAPEAVRQTARRLAGSVGTYAYVSSLTVYAWPVPGPLTESAPVSTATSGEDLPYPQRKAAAEWEVREAFGERALLVRPGLVVGPWEYPGRLPWWLLRLLDGGAVLAPGPPTRYVQYVDARDLAGFLLHCGRHQTSGAYNLVCPPGTVTMASLLDACRRATLSTARFWWVDQDWLLAAGVVPWTELPLWVPTFNSVADIYDVDVSMALAAGARFRPVDDTIRDTWTWLRGLDADAVAALGTRARLTREREAGLLAAWQRHRGQMTGHTSGSA